MKTQGQYGKTVFDLSGLDSVMIDVWGKCSSHDELMEAEIGSGEVATMLGVTDRWVRELAAAGEIPCTHEGKAYRFKFVEVLQWQLRREEDAYLEQFGLTDYAIGIIESRAELRQQKTDREEFEKEWKRRERELRKELEAH